MGGLSKLGIALTTIFVFALVALAAELFYVLWSRRVFHRQAPRHLHPSSMQQGIGNSPQAVLSSADSAFTTTSTSLSSYSKELIYFYLCLSTARITRVEPNSAPPSLTSAGSGCPDDHEEVIDVFKLHNMYGPSRVLFTIKEEGDRESDSDREKHSNNVSKRSFNLEEHLMAAAAGDEDCFSATVLEVEEELTGGVPMENDHQATPFSTPCQSPFYFTPPSSPIHLEEETPPSVPNHK